MVSKVPKLATATGRKRNPPCRRRPCRRYLHTWWPDPISILLSGGQYCWRCAPTGGFHVGRPERSRCWPSNLDGSSASRAAGVALPLSLRATSPATGRCGLSSKIGHPPKQIAALHCRQRSVARHWSGDAGQPRDVESMAERKRVGTTFVAPGMCTCDGRVAPHKGRHCRSMPRPAAVPHQIVDGDGPGRAAAVHDHRQRHTITHDHGLERWYIGQKLSPGPRMCRMVPTPRRIPRRLPSGVLPDSPHPARTRDGATGRPRRLLVVMTTANRLDPPRIMRWRHEHSGHTPRGRPSAPQREGRHRTRARLRATLQSGS
jgi:hypothetical protein